MALVNCPECGKDVSDKAITCPNCGNPFNNVAKIPNVETQNNTSKKKIIQVGVIIAVIIAIIIGINAYNKTQAKLPVNQMKNLAQIVADEYLNTYVSEIEYGTIKSNAKYMDSYVWYMLGKDDNSTPNNQYTYEYYVETSDGGIELTVRLDNWDIYAPISTGIIYLSNDFDLYDSVHIYKTDESFNECKKSTSDYIKKIINEEPDYYSELNNKTMMIVYSKE